MNVVCDSSALMHLAAIGHLELLRKLFSEIHVPEDVYDEVVGQGAGKPGAAEVAGAGWIKHHAVTNTPAIRAMRLELDPGEAACIVLAGEIGADLTILDDGEARARAELQGLRITGTVGVLLAADARGMVHFPETLRRLLESGFWLSSSEQQRVLSIWRARRSGEAKTPEKG